MFCIDWCTKFRFLNFDFWKIRIYLIRDHGFWDKWAVLGLLGKLAKIRYEGHSEVLIRPLAFWILGEVKNSAHCKVKREDWNGGKREKVGQLCPSTETAGLWSTAGANCIHLIKQSMTALSGKAIVLPRNVPELDPTNSRYPSFNYPRWRIELASVLAIITSFWRIHCIGKR